MDLRCPPSDDVKQERALAGRSGGASRPCRPGLKTEQKVITVRNARNDDQMSMQKRKAAGACRTKQ